MNKTKILSLTKVTLVIGLLMSSSLTYASGQQQQTTALNWPAQSNLIMNDCTNLQGIDPKGNDYLFKQVIEVTQIDAAQSDTRLQSKSVIGTVLLTAAITAGVDYVANSISENAAESMTTVSNFTNVIPQDEIKNKTRSDGQRTIKEDIIKPKCLTFKNGDVSLTIGLYGIPNSKGTINVMQAKLLSLTYPKTIKENKAGKTRDLMVQLAVSEPTTSGSSSQTIVLSDIQSTNGTYSNKPLNFPFMSNPFLTTTKDGDARTNPFTLTVSLTETKDASEVLSFLSSVANAANDDLTTALVESIDRPEADADAAAQTPEAIDPNAIDQGLAGNADGITQ